MEPNGIAAPNGLADVYFQSTNPLNLTNGETAVYTQNQQPQYDFSSIINSSQIASSPYADYMNQEGLFGLTNGTWGNIGTMGKLGTGLANAYLGYKNYGLAQDTFAFNKDMKEKEYAMAKDAYDRQVARASSIGNQMQAGAVN